MSEFDEMPIKTMKSILEGRGISTKGMLERAELEKALRSSTPPEAAAGGGGGSAAEGGGGGAGAAKQKVVIERGDSPVRVVFLAERHYDDKCDSKNIRLITEFLLERKNVPAESVIFVSEGQGVNPCYQHLGIPAKQIIREYTPGSELPTFHYLQLFMLHTQQFEDTLDGYNPSSRRELTISSLSAANLLVRIPNNEGMNAIRQLIDLALAGNIPGYAALIMNLYQLIHDHAFNHEKPAEKQFLQGLTASMLANDGRFAYAFSDDGPLEKIFNKREKAIIAKMEERVKADNSISTIVIIFGRHHYKNFKTLLSSSSLFLLDDTLTNTTLKNGRNANNNRNARNARAAKIAEARAQAQRKRKTRRERQRKQSRKTNKK